MRAEYNRGYADGQAAGLRACRDIPLPYMAPQKCCDGDGSLQRFLMGLFLGLFLGLLSGLFIGLFISAQTGA